MYYPYYYRQKASQSKAHMILTGMGRVTAIPNMLRIDLGILTEAERLEQAQDENNLMSQQVIQALIQLGLLDRQIQTKQYSVRPVYDYVDGKQLLRGYQVQHVLTITVEDLTLAGSLIDTAVKNGVNQVLNLQFFVKNEAEYYKLALHDALHDVLGKAESIATTLDVHINKTPIKIEEIKQEQPILYQTFALEKQMTETPIQPGEIVITAEVKAYFQYHS